MTDFVKKSDIAYKITLASVFLQMLLIVAYTLIWVPTHKEPNVVVCILQLIPLLMCLPWLLKRNIRAHICICFLVLGYFMAAVMSAFLWKQTGWIPFVEVANTVVMFNAAMMFARWEQKRYQISVTR